MAINANAGMLDDPKMRPTGTKDKSTQAMPITKGTTMTTMRLARAAGVGV